MTIFHLITSDFRVDIPQVDEMLKRRLGNEDALFSELAEKYEAKEDTLIADLVSMKNVYMRLSRVRPTETHVGR